MSPEEISKDFPDPCPNSDSSSLQDRFCVDKIQVPRRNLTEAFEEVASKPGLNEPSTGLTMDNSESPTGVSEIGLGKHCDESNFANGKVNRSSIPEFCLHPDLQRELSHALVNRVSFYGLIHDINKEACAMATGDILNLHKNPGDHLDPLIYAVKGASNNGIPSKKEFTVNVARIDEERWLLDVIIAQGPVPLAGKVCPASFSRAIGEQDYENPLQSLSVRSRTQLWKPSRSWWEAKSGKNPWIEPKSHNQRWR